MDFTVPEGEATPVLMMQNPDQSAPGLLLNNPDAATAEGIPVNKATATFSNEDAAQGIIVS